MTTQTKIIAPSSMSDDREWWRGGIIYQIYPRSFQDSNGDGIGDLPGITERLPYIKSLGVDAIWISPFFTSPMKDFGYDVSDYCDVDPMFGTLSDFDKLIETAHALDIRVMIDLVISHSSDQHPWFAESRQDRTNDKADWYVWVDPNEDGTPPNNWLSIFGGSAWQWDARREQYYLHNFLVSQPDLNFHNPVVQNEVLAAVRFWLERGVDGFRMDTLNFYFHDELLRSNPPMPKELRNDKIAPAVNPYNHQRHVYDRNRPENLEFLKRFRSLLDEYGAASVGEVGDAELGLKLIGDFTAGNERVNMCYAFDFLAPDFPEAGRIAEVMTAVDNEVGEGWCCWAFSNHDCVRHNSRWNLSLDAHKLMTTLIMTLRGSVCIYQGEELGLTEAELQFEDLQDPYGIEFWPEFKGRDGCRTPMTWQDDNANGGFSTGTPWLPVSPEHVVNSVAVQEANPEAILHHYRRAIALRQTYISFRKGDHSGVKASGTIAYFTRYTEDEQILCAFNISDKPAEFEIPIGTWGNIGAELGAHDIAGKTIVTLEPWQPILAKHTN